MTTSAPDPNQDELKAADVRVALNDRVDTPFGRRAVDAEFGDLVREVFNLIDEFVDTIPDHEIDTTFDREFPDLADEPAGGSGDEVTGAVRHHLEPMHRPPNPAQNQ